MFENFYMQTCAAPQFQDLKLYCLVCNNKTILTAFKHSLVKFFLHYDDFPPQQERGPVCLLSTAHQHADVLVTQMTMAGHLMTMVPDYASCVVN